MAKSKVAYFVLFLGSLAALYLGKSLAGRQGLLFAFILMICINTAIYFYGEIRLKAVFNSKRLEGRDPYNLVSLTAELAATFHIPAPEIHLCNLNSPTAFSIGRNQHSSSIILSQMLVDKLDRDELKAVLACEMYKIKEQFTFTATLHSSICAFLLGCTEGIDRILCLNQIKPAKLGPLTGLLAPLLGQFLKLTQNKKSLLEVDRKSSEKIHGSKDLASAIWKLDSLIKTQPSLVPKDTAHLFFINPLPQYAWTIFFSSQPSAKERIENLTGQYPI